MVVICKGVVAAGMRAWELRDISQDFLCSVGDLCAVIDAMLLKGSYILCLRCIDRHSNNHGMWCGPGFADMPSRCSLIGVLSVVTSQHRQHSNDLRIRHMRISR